MTAAFGRDILISGDQTIAKKHVKSTDPRKPAIVAALKAKAGGNKVTLLQETSPGVFEAEVMVYAGKGKGQPRSTTMGGPGSYTRLGRFRVTAAECGLEDACSKCKAKPATDGCCPYAAEIDDIVLSCDCCEDCRDECAMSV